MIHKNALILKKHTSLYIMYFAITATSKVFKVSIFTFLYSGD